MKIPLLRGRGFHTVSAFSDESQVVVSQAMAERWLGGDGIGAVLRFPQFGPGWTFGSSSESPATRGQNVASARPDRRLYINRGTSWMYLIVRGASLQECSVRSRPHCENHGQEYCAGPDWHDGFPCRCAGCRAACRGCYPRLFCNGRSRGLLVAGMYSTGKPALHDSRRRLAIKAAIGATPGLNSMLRSCGRFSLIALGGILAGGIVGLVLVGFAPELDSGIRHAAFG